MLACIPVDRQRYLRNERIRLWSNEAVYGQNPCVRSHLNGGQTISTFESDWICEGVFFYPVGQCYKQSILDLVEVDLPCCFPSGFGGALPALTSSPARTRSHIPNRTYNQKVAGSWQRTIHDLIRNLIKFIELFPFSKHTTGLGPGPLTSGMIQIFNRCVRNYPM